MIDNSLVDQFSKWLERKGISEETRRQYVNYLRKFKTINPQVILEKKLSKNCIKSLRNYIRFAYEIGLIEEEDLDRYLKLLKLPKPSRIPRVEEISESEVRDAFRKIKREDIRLVYEILLFSGCRLTEALKLIKSYNPKKFKPINNEYGRYPLMSERGSKLSLWIYLPNNLLPKIEKMKTVHLTRRSVTHYAEKLSILRPKYLRKFFYQLGIDLGIDRETVDFMQGRISRLSIGSRHYDSLLARADKEYQKIIHYLKGLLSSS